MQRRRATINHYMTSTPMLLCSIKRSADAEWSDKHDKGVLIDIGLYIIPFICVDIWTRKTLRGSARCSWVDASSFVKQHATPFQSKLLCYSALFESILDFLELRVARQRQDGITKQQSLISSALATDFATRQPLPQIIQYRGAECVAGNHERR